MTGYDHGVVGPLGHEGDASVFDGPSHASVVLVATTSDGHQLLRAMEMGLFRIKETAITHPDGHVTINRTPKVTGKGQRYFIDRYGHGREIA